MNIEDPRWEAYEARFTEVAALAEHVEGRPPAQASAEMLLFLYGENGLPPEEEFAMLERMQARAADLKRVEVETSYWQDTALFVP